MTNKIITKMLISLSDEEHERLTTLIESASFKISKSNVVRAALLALEAASNEDREIYYLQAEAKAVKAGRPW
ncbi:TPA: hypothetical protein R4E97_003537 [Salmonella enterica subsp. enterica serovar Ohio]|uniref:hypothetical protein n=1 Tax=Enterobacteriaceae TaxID=543 RepID=UPI00127A3559|nr:MULTISPECIES: hypothetical protein [Enterobacteriaceae]EBG6175549.1 hypothetical protein [Salmonella enterica]EBX4631088.1 hypothetical protein [Salmonella enterica subsp. enterica serovar Infantis]ECU4356178.1 hypothetical protein [Salmonella enterica subsp. enterica serovar Braenderup]HCT1437441.1 hypothetical protein [Salmonella enterica subsp. enterica serovar Ohio]EBL8165795.1 hypothetical protein [Salmonella enterica]